MKELIAALNQGKTTVICSACLRLLFVLIGAVNAELQLSLFDMQPLAEERISEAKTYVEEGLKRGVICPCCEQSCSLKKNTLTKPLVEYLFKLACVYSTEDGWVDIKDHVGESKHFRRLKIWGLAEERTDPDKGKGLGLWRATEAGQDFIRDQAQVSEIVYTYNGKPHGFGDRVVTIQDYQPQVKEKAVRP